MEQVEGHLLSVACMVRSDECRVASVEGGVVMMVERNDAVARDGLYRQATERSAVRSEAVWTGTERQ